jgi:hypothetical protein
MPWRKLSGRRRGWEGRPQGTPTENGRAKLAAISPLRATGGGKLAGSSPYKLTWGEDGCDRRDQDRQTTCGNE